MGRVLHSCHHLISWSRQNKKQQEKQERPRTIDIYCLCMNIQTERLVIDLCEVSVLAYYKLLHERSALSSARYAGPTAVYWSSCTLSYLSYLHQLRRLLISQSLLHISRHFGTLSTIIASERSERADLVVSRARFFAIYRSLRALDQ